MRRYDQLHDLDGLMDRLVRLRQEGRTAGGIAEQLNREGYRTPKRRTPFTAWVVRQLLHRRERSTGTAVGPLRSDEWWLPDLARSLEMTPGKLRDWVLRGWVQARQATEYGPWIIWADAGEFRRLELLRARSWRGVRSHPKELTVPPPREDD